MILPCSEFIFSIFASHRRQTDTVLPVDIDSKQVQRNDKAQDVLVIVDENHVLATCGAAIFHDACQLGRRLDVIRVTIWPSSSKLMFPDSSSKLRYRNVLGLLLNVLEKEDQI
jgi:hypothetical protein